MTNPGFVLTDVGRIDRQLVRLVGLGDASLVPESRQRREREAED
jgi:hypothetical protein